MRRVRAPFEDRGAYDLSSRDRLTRVLKEAGIVVSADALVPQARMAAPLPRVIVKRPRSGYFHPAGKEEILELLRFFGDECTYGIRTIELVQSGSLRSEGRLCFGRLSIPGRIFLYEQPHSPWLLPGTLPENERQALLRAGAVVELVDGSMQTLVSWQPESLRDFMLFDVLMHEVGHHLLQHHEGKRLARVARTADHEALAERFAMRCRLQYRRDGRVAG